MMDGVIVAMALQLWEGVEDSGTTFINKEKIERDLT
jgi:hypothetical protein